MRSETPHPSLLPVWREERDESDVSPERGAPARPVPIQLAEPELGAPCVCGLTNPRRLESTRKRVHPVELARNEKTRRADVRGPQPCGLAAHCAGSSRANLLRLRPQAHR